MDTKIRRAGKRSIIADLTVRLREYTGQPDIFGSIELKANHDYFWYLEFGTGTRFQGGTENERLTRPGSVSERQGRSDPYPITHRGSQTALSKKRRVRFEIGGQVYFRVLVLHPGARPGNRGRGIVRLGIRQAQIDLKKKLSPYHTRRIGSKATTFPTRKELVDAVNESLSDAVDRIRQLTPADPNSPHAVHLRDSWTYRPAK